MKPQPILQRYAFYRHRPGGRKRLMAVLNAVDEAAGYVKLSDNFPNHESESWTCKHVGRATTGPSAA